MQKKISLLLVFSLVFLLVGCSDGGDSGPKEGTLKVAQPIDKETTEKVTNSTITFNGQQKSSTGFSQTMETGSYKLKVEKENYEIWEEEVTIKESKENVVTPELVFGDKEVETGPNWQDISQPSNVSSSFSGDYIKISWDIPDTKVAGYKIYRSRTEDLPSKPFKVVEKEDLLEENNSYDWIDPTVEKQETYHYWLEAYNDSGIVSQLSSKTNGIFVDLYAVNFDYESTISGLDVYLFSDINDWKEPIGQLSEDNGNGVYDFTIDLNSGEYKYLFYLSKWIVPDGADDYADDNVGGQNAVANVPAEEDSYIFEYTPAEGGFNIYLASEINGWGEAVGNDEWKLTDENDDGTYQLTVPLDPGEYEYKYVIDKVVRDDSNSDKLVDSDQGEVSAVVVGN
ncbi:MAG: PEGA domain-containing protein [Bacillota bacterium]